MDDNMKVALAKAVMQAKARAKAEQEKKEQQEAIKPSAVPTVPTPIERANALKRKEANKYAVYIASKSSYTD